MSTASKVRSSLAGLFWLAGASRGLGLFWEYGPWRQGSILKIITYTTRDGLE